MASIPSFSSHRVLSSSPSLRGSVVDGGKRTVLCDLPAGALGAGILRMCGVLPGMGQGRWGSLHLQSLSGLSWHRSSQMVLVAGLGHQPLKAVVVAPSGGCSGDCMGRQCPAHHWKKAVPLLGSQQTPGPYAGTIPQEPLCALSHSSSVPALHDFLTPHSSQGRNGLHKWGKALRSGTWGVGAPS